MDSLQKRTRKEAASNVAEPGISHENAKMEDKQDKAAQHGEAQHMAATEARQEEATTAEGAETSVSKQHERAERRRCEHMDSYRHAAQSNYSEGRLGNEI